MAKASESTLCRRGEEMLAYLYNEIPSEGRESFERHLVECGPCVDSFAALSHGRFSVYEWKLLEFDQLPTPEIRIPVEGRVGRSWFDGIRSQLTFNPAPSFASIAAALVLTALVGYLFLSGYRADSEIAQDHSPAASPSLVDSAAPDLAGSPAPDGPATFGNDTQPRVNEVDAPGSAKVSTRIRPRVRASKAKPVQSPKVNAPAVPVMSSIEDDEDDSIRLSDMFDEIGTSK